ncbi:DNA polymerase III subunit delta [uncultured Amaricoccus sp.]|uniref:DNA polymerase III subunit delta n=1 Tax=uncultured Amaricoccus sp. TaxID=339341 RepID=UPI002637930F|nr:DNA polymerase III subunit delta [uncultured Amaricoccus sp.]
MKLSGREAARYLAAPDPAGTGALLFGADATRVALKRAALVTAMIGPDGAAEMRLTRITGADLRRDPAALEDALKAIGFFPGPRAVLVEEATDGLAPLVATALGGWRPGDARLVVTAGALGTGSALRKTFEKAPGVAAIGIYDDPPSREEVAADLAKVGLGAVSREALADAEAIARALDPGDFAQLVEKLALYKRGDPAPLSPEDLAACAPPTQDADIDELLDLAAEGRPAALAGAMRRLAGQAPTSLTIAAARHFRALYAAACATDGPEAALGRARPPVFGPRRARMAGQARSLGADRARQALGLVMDAELRLRSSRPTPGLALVERLLVRIATLRRE